MAVTKYATDAIYREGGKKKTAVQVMQERIQEHLHLMKHSNHIEFNENNIPELGRLKDWATFNCVKVKGKPSPFYVATLTIDSNRAERIGLELTNSQEEKTF